MNKAVPWSVKGVGFDAREAAKEAARRSGMTLGDWLNSAIAEQAADMGAEVEDMDEDGRLEAVTARLARLSDRIPASAARLRRSEKSWRQPPPRAAVDDSAEEDFFPVRRARRPTARVEPRETPFAQQRTKAVSDPEELLEQAIRRLERGGRGPSEDADAALAHVASRLSDIEQRLAHRTPETADPVRRTLARLEERLEEFGRSESNEPLNEMLRQFDRKISRLASRTDAERATNPGPAAADIKRLEARIEELAAHAAPSPAKEPQKLDRLEAKLDELREALRATTAMRSADPVSPPHVETPVAGVRGGVGGAVAAIERRQQHLDSRLPASSAKRLAPLATEAPAPRRSPDAAATELRRQIAELAERLEDMRREVVRPSPAPPSAVAAPNPQIAFLHDELKALSRAVSGLAPREEVHSLAGAIQELGAKITAGAGGVDPETIGRIHGQAQDIRDLLAAALARPQPFDQLERRLCDLAERIDRSAVDAASSAEIVSGLRDLRATLARSAPDALVRALETRLETLSRKIDETPARTETFERFGELNQHIETVHQSIAAKLNSQSAGEPPAFEKMLREINAKLERSQPLPDTGRLENLLHDIAVKLDRPADQTAPLALEKAIRDVETKLDDIAGRNLLDGGIVYAAPPEDVQRLEDILLDMGANLQRAGALPSEELLRLDESIRDLGSRFDQSMASAAPDTRPLEDLIRALADKIDAVERRSSEPLEMAAALVQEVRGLADKMEETRQAEAGAASLDTLQSQIENLSARLEGSDAGLQALAQIERSMNGLFTQLSDTRQSALEIAHAAAREVATEMLGESGAQSESFDLAQDLVGLREAQDASDRRVHQTLTVVHDTLEKMVDRLAAVEHNVADARPAAQPDGPESGATSTTMASGQPPVFAASPKPAVSEAVASQRSELPQFDPQHKDSPGSLRHVRPWPTPADEEVLIEPGSGFAPERRGEADDHAAADETRSEQSSFIAAARRAIKIHGDTPSEPRPRARNQHEELVNEAKARARAAAARLDAEAEEQTGTGRINKLRAYMDRRKRPILYGLAAVVLALCSLQVVSAMLDRPNEGATSSAPSVTPAKPKAGKIGPVAPKILAPGQSGDLITSPGNRPKLGALSVRPSALDKSASAAPIAPVPLFAASAASLPTGSIRPPVSPAATRDLANLRSAALGGDRLAQYDLATRLAEGRGLPRNLELSAHWFAAAAKQGLAPAEYRLGVIYEKGFGVAADPAVAIKWYRRAADAGHIRAMHNLAVLSAQAGAGGKPDYLTAADWFHKAAEYGVRDSQYNLAILYARGLGVQRSLKRSYVWFAIAAGQGDPDAAKKRDEVGAGLDVKQLAAAKAIVAKFKPRPETVSANEVTLPAGGWSWAANKDQKSSHKPGVSGV
ncbi:MAG TPA: hypothetical protein VMU56_07725 [Beijerinckiaceae bacterium]|nr:hypothetical protein [Beijerinckiaceae bacterium]